MADQNPMAHHADAADEDLQDQALVLDRLLVHSPTHMQVSDLQRELQLGDDDFGRRDCVRPRRRANCIGRGSPCAQARSSFRREQRCTTTS